jgi:hypothetical protein
LTGSDPIKTIIIGDSITADSRGRDFPAFEVSSTFWRQGQECH